MLDQISPERLEISTEVGVQTLAIHDIHDPGTV
jgi:hypothetical protein